MTDVTKVGSRSVPFALGGVLLAIVGGVVVLGVMPAIARREALASEAAQQSAELPKVVFATVAESSEPVRNTLPARFEAAQETALYAQVGGYLGDIRADIGDRVKAGQTLVEIAVPLLDEQIAQNRAARDVALARIEVASARLSLSAATLARLRAVGDPRAVSPQALDEAAANAKSDEAGLAAARADLAAVDADGRRLVAEKALARIEAPFDGEVTERNFDRGALIVENKTDAAKPIFRVIRRDEIRALVGVPEVLATSVAVGSEVEFRVRELGPRVIKAPVVRMSPSLQGESRTRLVEVRIPNGDGALLPGMYALATVELARARATAVVPGEAIVIRDGKTHVAVVDAQDSLHYLPVQVARDTGVVVELADALPVGTRIAVNLSRQLADGAKVQPVARAAK